MKTPLILLLLAILASQVFALCGTLTADYTMLANEVSLSGSCFTIGANNITLNCAGFTIINGVPTNDGYGIKNTEYDNVTIKNCLLANFQYGIYYTSNADNGTVLNTQFTNKNTRGYGLYFDTTNNTKIDGVSSKNNFVNGAAMAWFGYSDNLIIANSTFTNINGGAIATYIGSSNNVQIINSSFSSKLNYSLILDTSDGAIIQDANSYSAYNFSITLQTSDNGLIKNTTTTSDNHIALYLAGGSNNTAIMNVTAHSSGWDAIHISGSPYTYIANSTAITDNSSLTPPLFARPRAVFIANSNNVTMANSTVYVTNGYGILIGQGNSSRIINTSIFAPYDAIPLDYEIATNGYAENVNAFSYDAISVYVNATSSNIRLVGLAANSTNNTAIYLNNSNNIWIENSTARSNRGNALFSQSSDYINIINTTGFSNFSHGAYFNGDYINISNSRFTANGTSGIGLYLLKADYLRLTASDIYSRFSYGIYALGTPTQIIGLSIINTTASSFTDRGLFAFNHRNLYILNSSFISNSLFGADLYKANASTLLNGIFIGNITGLTINQSNSVSIINSSTTATFPVSTAYDFFSAFFQIVYMLLR